MSIQLTMLSVSILSAEVCPELQGIAELCDVKPQISAGFSGALLITTSRPTPPPSFPTAAAAAAAAAAATAVFCCSCPPGCSCPAGMPATALPATAGAGAIAPAAVPAVAGAAAIAAEACMGADRSMGMPFWAVMTGSGRRGAAAGMIGPELIIMGADVAVDGGN